MSDQSRDESAQKGGGAERPAEAPQPEAAGPSVTVTTGQGTIRSLLPLFVWIVVLIMILKYIQAVQFIVLVFLTSAILAELLRPLTEKLPGPPNTRAVLAVGILIIVVAGVLFLLGWMLYAPLQGYVSQWPAMQDKINNFLARITAQWNLGHQPTILELGDQAARLLTGASGGTLVGHIIDAIFTIIIALLVIIVGAMYLIAEPRMMQPAIKLLPPGRQDKIYKVIAKLGPQLRWYVIGQVLGMIMVGIASAIGYLIVGLPFALPVALFAAIAEIVPTFGPMITLMVAALVGATAGLSKVFGAIIVYAIVQTLESYVLIPVLMRRTVNVPPIATLLTVVLWGNVFGPAGLILAVPIDLVIWSLLAEYIVRPHEEQAMAAQAPVEQSGP